MQSAKISDGATRAHFTFMSCLWRKKVDMIDWMYIFEAASLATAYFALSFGLVEAVSRFIGDPAPSEKNSPSPKPFFTLPANRKRPRRHSSS